MEIAYVLVNTAVLLLFPLLMIGVINKTKAFWGGRKGPSVFQPFYDVLKLVRKGRTISSSTGWMFNSASVLSLPAVLCAAAVVPMVGGIQIVGFEGDFVFFMYVLGISRFLMVIMAMDTGSSFEGMGSSREASFSTFTEPAFFLFAGTLALLSGNLSFGSMIATLPRGAGWTELITFVAAVMAFVIMLAETCRVPVDDPTTHLELTMIHEVMVLDSSGFDLAVFTFQNALKMLVWSAIISALLFPASGILLIDVSVLVATFLAVSVFVGTIESSIARLRMNTVPQFLFTMITLGLIILSASVFFSKGGFN